MKNPYYIDEPACISFSGGRTSAYMLIQILEAHHGTLPREHKVIFCNTGKEMPETLDFVYRCERELSVPIVWLECYARAGGEGENKYVYETKVVDYESASRNGEPFESLLRSRQYLPNVVARFCTKELKVMRVRDYMNRFFENNEYLSVLGIRYDEPRRAAKLDGISTHSGEGYLPLYHAKVTARDVGDFWSGMPWDLELPNNNGVTDWGNCDLCFLKGTNKRLSLIRARPDLADWWIRMEDESPNKTSTRSDGVVFCKDAPSYRQLYKMATETEDLFGFDTESIPCFCGD